MLGMYKRFTLACEAKFATEKVTACSYYGIGTEHARVHQRHNPANYKIDLLNGAQLIIMNDMIPVRRQKYAQENHGVNRFNGR